MHLNRTTVTIYTDGSGIKGKISAAAYNAARNEASHQHLGNELQFTVYTAELTALHLTVKQLRNQRNYMACRIYTDSQAAVKAIDYPRKQSGQAIIKDILESIDKLVNEYTHMQIEIIWIPGHAEIEGNERADTEAKLAATDPTLSRPPNTRHYNQHARGISAQQPKDSGTKYGAKAPNRQHHFEASRKQSAQRQAQHCITRSKRETKQQK